VAQTGNALIRSSINQETPWVRREVVAAGCFSTLTVTPPAITGGLIAQNVDPFAMMFDPPYRMNLVKSVDVCPVLRSVCCPH
jgi:hypothetical protein